MIGFGCAGATCHRRPPEHCRPGCRFAQVERAVKGLKRRVPRLCPGCQQPGAGWPGGHDTRRTILVGLPRGRPVGLAAFSPRLPSSGRRFRACTRKGRSAKTWDVSPAGLIKRQGGFLAFGRGFVSRPLPLHAWGLARFREGGPMAPRPARLWRPVEDRRNPPAARAALGRRQRPRSCRRLPPAWRDEIRRTALLGLPRGRPVGPPQSTRLRFRWKAPSEVCSKVAPPSWDVFPAASSRRRARFVAGGLACIGLQSTGLWPLVPGAYAWSKGGGTMATRLELDSGGPSKTNASHLLHVPLWEGENVHASLNFSNRPGPRRPCSITTSQQDRRLPYVTWPRHALCAARTAVAASTSYAGRFQRRLHSLAADFLLGEGAIVRFCRPGPVRC